jgi:hypothetical protein
VEWLEKEVESLDKKIEKNPNEYKGVLEIIEK